jgi:probable F420-dependent oxidoreductase
MRLGFFLPQIGPWAGPEALAQAARRAEDSGYDSLWVTERSLFPLEPKTPYPLGDLPEVYKTVLDPLDALTFVAGQTSRVTLGTSVLNLPWYSPVLLARRLSTLDVLSNGRLRVGLGIGWSQDEYEAAGIPWQGRGRRFEEAIQALKAIWTTDPVEFDGEFYSIPRSHIGPKPVQKPHPPIYMGAFAPSALMRVARYGDGWNPVGVPPEGIAEMFSSIQTMAEEAGRDPAALELIVRGNVTLVEDSPGEERWPFTGTSEQLSADISATRALGATELILDATFDPGVKSSDDFVERMELLSGLAAEVVAG